MTDEEINRAIHEKVLGNVMCHHVLSQEYGPKRCSICGMLWSEWESIPDYCNDLNAVTVAERAVIEAKGFDTYGRTLTSIHDYKESPLVATASAKTRSLAVLRAMEIEL